MRGNARTLSRRQRLTLDTHASPFGCCNYFDACTDEIMTLSFGGQLPLLDWMGFNVTEECYRSVEFITYVRPEQTLQGTDTAGYLSDPCDTPNGFEFGTRKLTVEDFGRYGRSGPVRDIVKPLRYCKTRPRYRLDGSPVESEDEWDMLFATDTLLNDIRQDLVSGSAAVSGQFDGLQQWVATTHGGMLNSYVIDWNDNVMDGGAGITVNGTAIANTFNIIDVLISVIRRIRQRISWSKWLQNQVNQMQIGDMILVLPTFLKDCLLDYFTCWSVCEGSQYSEVNLQTYEARQFRKGLIANVPENLFGDGYITVDSFPIPILTYDWDTITGPTRGDMYVLTGSVGNVRIWEGEHLDATRALERIRTNLDSSMGYFTADGGRLLGKKRFDNECIQMSMWMHPRLFCYAPWAQVRFQDVRCTSALDPLSPDPAETSFYPESSFDAAECS
jgi:hypothetical protein